MCLVYALAQMLVSALLAISKRYAKPHVAETILLAIVLRLHLPVPNHAAGNAASLMRAVARKKRGIALSRPYSEKSEQARAYKLLSDATHRLQL